MFLNHLVLQAADLINFNLNFISRFKRSYTAGCTRGNDALLRVPLVIRGGAYKGGHVVKDLVSTASIPKSLMAMAGIAEESPMISEDLSSLLPGKNETDSGRVNDIFAQISESRVGRVLRTKDYTYGVYAPGIHGGLHQGSREYADDYLYDLTKDPHQRVNVMDDPAYKDVKNILRTRLVQRICDAEYDGDTSLVRIS